MRILTESFGYLNESDFVKLQNNNIQSVFKKVDIYNKRKQQFINENRYNEILFTLNEQEAINDMVSYIQNKILENYLNEFGFADIKNAANKVVDKAKSAIDLLKTAPEKVKRAYAFCEKILKSGITKVSDFINKLLELFSELGDNCRDAILYLGGFGKESLDTEITESVESNPLSSYQGEEKEFLECVVEYVQAKQNTSESYFEPIFDNNVLNENKFLDGLQAKLDKHPVLSKILVGSFKGKKISWWKTILVSLVGSILIGTVLPMIVPILGTAVVGSFSISSLLIIVWGGRGILKSLLHRNNLVKQNDEKFWNWKFTLLLLLQASVLIVTQIPLVKEFLASLIQDGLKALHIDQGIDWCKDKVTELIGKIKGEGNLTIKVIDDTLATRTPSDTTQKVLTYGKSGAKSFKEYISTKLFGENGLFTDFKMDSEGIKNWLNDVNSLNAHGSSTVLNDSLPTLSSSDPLTFVVDGNTFQHVDRQELLKAVKEAGGRIFNYGNSELIASTGNQAGAGLAISFDCLPTQQNINEIMTILTNSSQSIKDAGVDVLLQCQNEISTETTGEIINAVTDNITTAFNGFAIDPIFDEKEIEKVVEPYIEEFPDKIKVSFGSEAKKYPYVRISNMKIILNSELKKELGKSSVGNYSGLELAKDQDEKNIMIITNSAEAAQQAVKSDKKENKNVDTKAIDKYVENVNKFTNLNEHKCLVFYTNKIEDDKKIEIPVLAMNFDTLQCIDLVNSKKLGTRKNPYFLKGLFNKLTIKPIDKQDESTKKKITEFLLNVLIVGIKQIAYKNIATTYTQNKDGQYIPAKGINSKDNRKELGNFSNNEICEILNDNKQAYKYFDGVYAEDIRQTDENGNATKTYKRGTNIEDKDEYVKNAIWPVISNPKTDVNKEIKADETIKKYKKLFNSDGELSDAIYKFNPIKNALFRSPSTYEEITGSTIAANLLKNNKNNKNIEEKVAAIQHLSEIVWKYKGDRSLWSKQLKQAGIKPEKIEKAEEKQEKIDKADVEEKTPKKTDKVENAEKDKMQDAYTWFEDEICKRLEDKKDLNRLKILYKEFCKNKAIKNHYKLPSDKCDISEIRKDKVLMPVMYTRNKTDKLPSNEFWTKKLPEDIKTFRKEKLNEQITLEKAKAIALVYKEIYLILRSYINTKAPDAKKRAWNRFLEEHTNLNYSDAKRLFEKYYFN